MQRLIIMQGVPGSGKSTLARLMQLNPEKGEYIVVCSTDDYFTKNGVYTFDSTKLPENHRKNFHYAIRKLSEGYTVIVDNTNIQAWQAKPYVAFAVDCNIPVEFIRCVGDFTSVHNVPESTVERMKSQLETLTVETVLASKSPY